MILSLGLLSKGEFVIKSLDLTQEQYNRISTCDQRSESYGNIIMSEVLREYLKGAPEKYTKLVVDSGEVTLQHRYPNERIPTGKKCPRYADARNVVGISRMIPNTVVMNKDRFGYNEILKLAIAGADVAAEMVFNANIKIRLGFRFFGKCRTYRSKTCSARLRSTGTMNLIIGLRASNYQMINIGGRDHVEFKMNAAVYEGAKGSSFSDLKFESQGSCKIRFLGISVRNLNNKVKAYATKFFGKANDYEELAAPKLMQKLQEMLGVKMGEKVTIPVNIQGGNRKKRSTTAGSNRTCPQTCPSGWPRLGNLNKCGKIFGLRRVNCKNHHPNAVLEVDNSAGIPIYICTIPM